MLSHFSRCKSALLSWLYLDNICGILLTLTHAAPSELISQQLFEFKMEFDVNSKTAFHQMWSDLKRGYFHHLLLVVVVVLVCCIGRLTRQRTARWYFILAVLVFTDWSNLSLSWRCADEETRGRDCAYSAMLLLKIAIATILIGHVYSTMVRVKRGTMIPPPSHGALVALMPILLQ